MEKAAGRLSRGCGHGPRHRALGIAFDLCFMAGQARLTEFDGRECDEAQPREKILEPDTTVQDDRILLRAGPLRSVQDLTYTGQGLQTFFREYRDRKKDISNE